MNDLARIHGRRTRPRPSSYKRCCSRRASRRCCGARPGSTCPTCSPPARATSWSRRRPEGARGPAPGRDRHRQPRGRGPTHARAAAGPRAPDSFLRSCGSIPRAGVPDRREPREAPPPAVGTAAICRLVSCWRKDSSPRQKRDRSAPGPANACNSGHETALRRRGDVRSADLGSVDWDEGPSGRTQAGQAVFGRWA